MNLLHPILLMVLLHLLTKITLSATVIQKPANIDAQKYILYNNTASMVNQQFNLTFTYAFAAAPVFVYGINDYKLGDQFAYQNFQSFLTALSVSTFSINVTSVGSTNVKTFSISYFAAQPETSFSNNFQNVTYGVNISTYSTSGYRYYEVYVGMNFSSSSAYAFPLLTGYYLTSSTYFQVKVTASVISTVNYKYKIETTSDCSLLRITFYVLFCQKSLMDSNNYYYTGGIDVVQSYNPTGTSNFTFSIDKYNQTVFLLGLRGFSGFRALTGCFWGWNVTNVTNNIANLIIYQNQLLYIQYSFFQIGKYVNITNNTQNNNTQNNNTQKKTNEQEKPTPINPTTTSSGSSNYLGIIIGVVVGIVITAVVIITFLKFYWKRAILNLPTQDDFRQMPSVSL